MNPAHFYYLLNMVAWPPIQRKASISCCKDKRKWLNWWRARSAHTVGTGSRSAACKGSMSAHGLHYFLWTYSTTVFDLLHSIIRISCVAVAMETPAFACFTAVPGTSWPFVAVGFRREREPKPSRLFAPTAGEWATRKPPTSEPFHRRFPLRDQVRWALSPGDLQHSRYSTATLPKLSDQPGARSTGASRA